MDVVARRGLNWPGRADVDPNSHHSFSNTPLKGNPALRPSRSRVSRKGTSPLPPSFSSQVGRPDPKRAPPHAPAYRENRNSPAKPRPAHRGLRLPGPKKEAPEL